MWPASASKASEPDIQPPTASATRVTAVSAKANSRRRSRPDRHARRHAAGRRVRMRACTRLAAMIVIVMSVQLQVPLFVEVGPTHARQGGHGYTITRRSMPAGRPVHMIQAHVDDMRKGNQGAAEADHGGVPAVDMRGTDQHADDEQADTWNQEKEGTITAMLAQAEDETDRCQHDGES